jgi:hypothetical protein
MQRIDFPTGVIMEVSAFFDTSGEMAPPLEVRTMWLAREATPDAATIVAPPRPTSRAWPKAIGEAEAIPVMAIDIGFVL